MKDDPLLHRKLDTLRDTPMQRKMRHLAPMPVGCVFIPWSGITEDEIREQFRTMKELGFTCLKQCFGSDRYPQREVMTMALEEGLIPYWYGEGGWVDITPDLLESLGLPPDMDIDEAMANEEVWEYQRQIIQRRIDRPNPRPARVPRARWLFDEREDHEEKLHHVVPSVVPHIPGYYLPERAVEAFSEWLKENYKSPEAVAAAWNLGTIDRLESKDDSESTDAWLDLARVQVDKASYKEYRRLRDVMRFRADFYLAESIWHRVNQQQERDPDEPIRAGGEMGLFLPFAARGTDMEGIAKAMAVGGSFYPSMHPSWHFEEVDFELARPAYMQASTAADWAKGVWSATWESTGGPQYFSGGKSPFVEETRDKFPGLTIDANAMTQLMFSYLAAGFRGFGLWTWNAREAGWEGGEFALTDRNRKVTERARQVGRIGKAACKWRREMWESHKEPLVGVLMDWDSDAFWGAMAVTGRDRFKSEPMRARVGICRALIDHNVPWEHVTTGNLLVDGLAPRYPILYLPAMISIGSDLHDLLLSYVKQGGRVVIDMPGAYYDEFGRVYKTDEGTLFEQTFGCTLNEFAFANHHNTPDQIGGVELFGFMADLTPTFADVRARFAKCGLPAVTEAKVGNGSAVVIGTQASLDCYRPGNASMEELIVRQTLGDDHRTPFECTGCIAYRRAAPGADHYFLINDGNEAAATLTSDRFSYTSAEDAVSGEEIDLSGPFTVPMRSGRWIRCVRA